MQTNYNERKKKIMKKALLATLIHFTLFTVFFIIILRQVIVADRERYGYIARNQADHIVTTIDCVMSRTNTLKTMIKENNGEIDWFDNVAEDIYLSIQDETGVSPKNVAIAPKGIVADVYPLEGNEKLVGFNFLDTSLKGNLEAKEAYEKGNTILTNPFELIQGGIGMGGRAAVLIRNGDTETLWGLVTVTIDFENLIEVLRLDNLKGMGVDYSLSYIDQDGSSKFIYGMKNLDKNSVKTQFHVRNLTWELDVKPSKGWVSMWNIVVAVLIVLVLSCFAGLLTYMMQNLRESNALLQHLSITDVLTGCYNRRAYEEKINEIVLQGLDDDFVYVSADLNGLKHFNDTFGHTVGDELLSGAAYCLQKGLGQYGSVYRVGGDEFVALIQVKEELLIGILEEMNSIVNSWKGNSVDHMSISIGVASHHELPDMTIEELIKEADAKMYEVKDAYYRKHAGRREI